MSRITGDPASDYFESLRYTAGSTMMKELTASELISPRMAQACASAPKLPAVYWGIQFAGRGVVCAAGEPVQIEFRPRLAGWLVFLHTAEFRPLETRDGGLISPMPGEGRLNERLADYVFLFEDGSEERV